MKTFYLKISITSKVFEYAVHFKKNILTRGEKGKGQYLSFKAKDRRDLKRNLENHDFSGLSGIVMNPTAGE